MNGGFQHVKIHPELPVTEGSRIAGLSGKGRGRRKAENEKICIDLAYGPDAACIHGGGTALKDCQDDQGRRAATEIVIVIPEFH